MNPTQLRACLAALLPAAAVCAAADSDPRPYFEAHCTVCHDAANRKGNLDLTALKPDLADRENFARWVKVHDRIEAGDMPPKGKKRPPADQTAALLKSLHQSLFRAEAERLAGGRTALRRLTRAEYENTVRDLFDLAGLGVQINLPPDGTSHGFDKTADALDVSHVNIAKYFEAADFVLDTAIATQPEAPTVHKQRISLANPGAGVAHIVMRGDAVMLKNMKPDPDFPPTGVASHIDQGAHERFNMFREPGRTVGLFRVEDESFYPYFQDFAALYPARYRIRTSLWSFTWDKGQVLPGRGTEAARISVVQFNENGRGGGHPSYVLKYLDAPSLKPTEHEFDVWFNYKETIGFNPGSLPPHQNTQGKDHLMGFKGIGVACDWLDIEGPLYDAWPPRGHKALFGDLPIVEFKPAENPGVHPPVRRLLRQEIIHSLNKPDIVKGLWTVRSDKPLADADRLLASFLPKAFRRPVPDDVRKLYVGKVEERLEAGDCFETAMRWAYRAALCSPDFLFHVEPVGKIDDHALACRLSYLLWNSMPDAELTALADSGKLRTAETLKAQMERLLADARSQRFVDDFLGQWLKLRLIGASDPDRRLYPEFSPYLQDSMAAETKAYFRELLDKNLDATHLIRSDFAMLNEKLAKHYGIPDVVGSQMRRVALPADCPRGPFLTQAAILKITANGTTTSPVPRGAFVMARLLGKPPEPPPSDVPAVEPDVRGTTTIREQLAKHRSNATCASCHAKIDPPGFALEAFDVIGAVRKQYRAIDMNKLKPGPMVDPSGELADGRKFADIREFQVLIAAEPAQLLTNLAQQFAVYGTGREIGFGDRDDIAGIVARTQKAGGGIRTLLHELVQSRLFQTK